MADHRGYPTKPASPQNNVFFGNFPEAIISMTCPRSLESDGPRRHIQGKRNPMCQSRVIQACGS